MTTVFINELHYNNMLVDQGEGFEIAGPAGTDLNGWKLELIEGAGGKVYKILKLSGVLKDQQNGYGTLFYPVSLFNAGTPSGDGFALVDPSGAVVQFLSYGGVVTANDGSCKGRKSTLLPVVESESTPIGHSLQLIGVGAVYEDFCWSGPTEKSYGKPNKNQTFAPWRREGIVIGPILHFRSSDSSGKYKISIVVAYKPPASGSVDNLQLTLEAETIEGPNKQTLLVKDDHHIIRYDITLQQTDVEQTIKYQFTDDKNFSFRVPGLGQPLRLGYASCNAAESEIDIPSDNLWKHMTNLDPYHVLIHGGDQVYTDLPHPFIWKMVKGFKDVVQTGFKTIFDTSRKFTPEIEAEVDDFFFHMYRRFWSQLSVRKVLATTPGIMMWDDHEIFDGYGSFYDEVQNSEIFRGIFNVARKYFSLFQVGATPQYPASTLIPGQPALSQFYYLNKVAIINLDMRSERNRSQILSPDSFNAFQKCLDQLLDSDIHHLFVMSGVPVLYDDFEYAAELIAGRNLDIEDDLTDHWTYKTHKEELIEFVTKLINFSTTKKCRTSILSGDVHCGCLAVITDKKRLKEGGNDCVINNITSSAIGSNSLHGFFVAFLDTATSLKSCKTHITEDIVAGLHKFTFPLSKMTAPTFHLADRNFLSLKFEKDNSLNLIWHLENKPMFGKRGTVYTVNSKIFPYDPKRSIDVAF